MGGAWFGGGMGGFKRGPGPAWGEDPGEAGSPLFRVSPLGRAQPCPAHPCSFSTDPQHDGREPSLPPGILGGAADSSLAGVLCPRPHRMPWVGWDTPQLSLCLPWDRTGVCPSPPGLLRGAPHSLGPSPGIPLPCGRSVRFQMKTKLWRDDTRTAGSPPWPGGASGFPAPRLAAGAPAFSPSFGVALSPSSLNPGVSQVAALALPPQPNWGLPPAASHYTPPCAG